MVDPSLRSESLPASTGDEPPERKSPLLIFSSSIASIQIVMARSSSERIAVPVLSRTVFVPLVALARSSSSAAGSSVRMHDTSAAPLPSSRAHRYSLDRNGRSVGNRRRRSRKLSTCLRSSSHDRRRCWLLNDRSTSTGRRHAIDEPRSCGGGGCCCCSLRMSLGSLALAIAVARLARRSMMPT